MDARLRPLPEKLEGAGIPALDPIDQGGGGEPLNGDV